MHAHNALVREQVTTYGGFEVKSMGDSFMLAFFSARRAVQCAIDIQRAFLAYNNDKPEEPILVRIGLHTGETIREADDFYGKNVILAYRIADQAKGGQILVSSLLRELTQSAGVSWRPRRPCSKTPRSSTAPALRHLSRWASSR